MKLEFVALSIVFVSYLALSVTVWKLLSFEAAVLLGFATVVTILLSD